MTECTCEIDEDGEVEYYSTYTCEVHVGCDQTCQALRNPQTCEEYKDSFEHYKSHPMMGGCSHGE